MIDLVHTESQQLNELRSVLLRDDREVLEEQRLVIETLVERVAELERMLIDTSGRTQAIQEVLVESIANSTRSEGELGDALRPEIEHAIYSSARIEDTRLAEAIYPVVGPAIRKMVADIFTLDKSKGGQAFSVEQVLLIERSTGLMLASTATDEGALEDADIVSGMIDALKTFVQEAFEADDRDGLSDLRVGDLSVLIESGPRAILASVVRGIPSQDYRDSAARTLEEVHMQFAGELDAFDGTVDPFAHAGDLLGDLHSTSIASQKSSSQRSLLLVAALAMVIVAGLIAVGAILF